MYLCVYNPVNSFFNNCLLFLITLKFYNICYFVYNLKNLLFYILIYCVFFITLIMSDICRPVAQLTFGGCGGMYNYSLGIASVIQKNFDLCDVAISGASAGCFPAFLLALGMDVDELFESWNIPFLNEVNKNYFGALCKWNNTVRRCTLPKFPVDAYIRAHSRLFCSLTSFPDFKNHLISDWKSNEDLLDGIMASAFVPLFDVCKISACFRGHRFIDGSLSNSYPLPHSLDIPSFIIRRDMWRSNKASWLWCWSDEEWARKLFEWGQTDAYEHLEEIGVVLPPITSNNS